MSRRSYGTGSLHVREDANGNGTWHARWYAPGGQRVKRRIGPARAPGSREGLTRAQAEQEMRRLMAEVKPAPAASERLDVADLGQRYRRHLEATGRKKSTLTAVESVLRVWLVPSLGGRDVAAVTPEDVEQMMRQMHDAGLGAKTIRNYVGTLSALFRFAMHPRRRWATVNPCDAVDLPAVEDAIEIRFLTVPEVEALAAAAVPGAHEATDRALYLTAAMTGLRQGELIALRWQDVDWHAQRIRVRRNHVLGEFGTPKSRRSMRSVPMAAAVAGELDRLSQSTRWAGDDDLVFAEPATGEPLRRGALMRRYRQALKAAKLGDGTRFHDLRHTFGTQMAAAGVPMRTLQEWMGHRDVQTTQRYADYAPNAHEADLVAAAFSAGSARGPIRGPILSESDVT